MDNWLTTKEAAEKVGLTYVRINQLIKSGELPAEKRGRDYFIREADVERLEQRPERRGRPPKAKVETDSKASKKGSKK
jgi:excisionase family DNA binding protein